MSLKMLNVAIVDKNPVSGYIWENILFSSIIVQTTSTISQKLI